VLSHPQRGLARAGWSNDERMATADPSTSQAAPNAACFAQDDSAWLADVLSHPFTKNVKGWGTGHSRQEQPSCFSTFSQ
jgi:hypothetical protein